MRHQSLHTEGFDSSYTLVFFNVKIVVVICLVHRSTRPTVDVMSPKPLFTKQRQAACSRWDITVGHKHCIQVISTSTVCVCYCVPAEGALMVCESKVTPTCRANREDGKAEVGEEQEALL